MVFKFGIVLAMNTNRKSCVVEWNEIKKKNQIHRRKSRMGHESILIESEIVRLCGDR
jgi:hypothetical protein